ncbi:MAG: putative bifunctional diguanylate cyclase/phosphodiesterase, partial [Bacteroidota bacterium]
GDTMARTSGDEFYFIFSGIEEEAASEIAAQRMLDAFKQPFLVDGQELYVTPSIGISLYHQDGTDAEAMIKNPEMAMYWAKAQGKNNFQRFTSSMGAAAAAKRTLEYQLRKALEREEFLVYYQPQVDLQSGRLIGAEALVRWNHPERGVLAPAHFVDVAEEAGFVVPMGEWVLKHAAQQNKRWQEAGLSPIRVAVNLSARQFKKGLVELVRDTLEETGLDPRFLELEITESIAMQNHEETILLLGKLHDLGVKLSIDDFGTGYSSLSYLKRFPIDALKIDRAFVKDLIRNADDRAIAEAILAMARSLKLKVIAEGVEEEEQVVFLQEKGCDEVQGYYFSRPIPAEEFHSFLRLSKLWGRV